MAQDGAPQENYFGQFAKAEGGSLEPASSRPNSPFKNKGKLASLAKSVVQSTKASRQFLAQTNANEDPVKLLTELREVVKRLDATEHHTTPTVAELEKKVRELDHSAKEMEPNVKMLVRDYQKVIDAVTSIEKLEKGREAIESERWRTLDVTTKLTNEQLTIEIESCVKANDLQEERYRVDQRIEALKKDVEIMSSDQLKQLHAVMGGEVGKVVTSVQNIRQSFDQALTIMRSRVDNIKQEFSVAKEEIVKEQQAQKELDHQLAETVVQQAVISDELHDMGRTFESTASRHTADIEVLQGLQQDLHGRAVAADAALAEARAEAAAGLAAVHRRIDALEEDLLKRFAAAKKEAELGAEEKVKALRRELGAAMGKQAAEAEARHAEVVAANERLGRQLAAADEARQADVKQLAESLTATHAFMEKQRIEVQAALQAARDDSQKGTERHGEELARRLVEDSEGKVAELRAAMERQVLALSAQLAEANEEAARLRQRAAGLEAREQEAAARASKLGDGFKSVEQSLAGWQEKHEAASRRFKLEMDGHLQQLEELLTEKVDSNRADVARLGRSNVGLAQLVQQARQRLAQLSAEDGSEWAARLAAHAERLTELVCVEEGGARASEPFLLSVPFQKAVSGAVQHIAAVVSSLADHEVVRALMVHPDPEDEDAAWDQQVDEARARHCREFTAKVYGLVAAKHPTINPNTLGARTKIFSKVELALRVALSKYQSILVGQTLFGRQGYNACAACNRPMVKLPSTPGDRRAVPKEPLPGAALKLGEHVSVSSWAPSRDEAKGAGPTAAAASPGPASSSASAFSSAAAGFANPAPGGKYPGAGDMPLSLPLSAHPTGNESALALRTGSNQAYVMRGGFKMPKKGPPIPSPSGSTLPSMPERPGTAPAGQGRR